MTAQIRTQYSKDVYANWSCETIGFYVYDPDSTFAGGRYDYCAWRFLGNASRYFPVIDGYAAHPIHVAPVALPNGSEFPVLNADSWSEANRYFEAFAQVYLTITAIEAEREEWHSMMLAAEAAEVRAHAILSDSPAVPPF